MNSRLNSLFRYVVISLLPFISFPLIAPAQSHSTHILRLTLNDSIKNYILKELIDYAPGSYQLQMNVSTTDLDTAPNLKKGNNPPSLADVKKQKKLLCNCPKDADVYLETGAVYEHLNMPDSAAANLDKAIRWCEKELKSHPDSLKLLENSVFAYYHKKDYNTSIARCEYLLSKYPKDSLAGALLPLLYYGTGDTASMMKYTRQKLARDSDDFYAAFFNMLGQAFSLLNNPRASDTLHKPFSRLPADSFADFRAVYHLERKFSQYHFYTIMDNYLHLFVYYILKSASADFSGSSTPQETLKRTDTLYLGRYLSFFSGLEKQPWFTNRYSVYKGLGFSYFLLHRYKEAAENFRKAIDAYPRGTGTYISNLSGEYMTLATCYWVMNDTLVAEKVIREAIRVNPGIDPDPYFYLVLGKNALHRHDFASARRHAESALKTNPQYADAFKQLAITGILEADYKTALQQCDKAYAVNKNDPLVFLLGGIANMLSGSPDTAYSMLKIAQSVYTDDKFLKDILENYFL